MLKDYHDKNNKDCQKNKFVPLFGPVGCTCFFVGDTQVDQCPKCLAGYSKEDIIGSCTCE